MDQKKVGSFLRELRKEKGITQEQLAEQLGVSGRTVSRWETGSNMPDISLLTDISDFYGISIPELINGERKSETMKEEVKEVAEAMSDYAGREKEQVIRNIRNLSIGGLCALIVYEVLENTGLSGRNAVFENIALYCQTLIYVTTLLIPLYTTGLIEKIRRRNPIVKLPKPVMLIVSAVAAFVVAAVLKLLLSKVFGL